MDTLTIELTPYLHGAIDGFAAFGVLVVGAYYISRVHRAWRRALS